MAKSNEYETEAYHLIPLYGVQAGGRSAMVSPKDVKLVIGFRWNLNAGGYVVSRGLFLHRLILNAPKGKVVDHINHDKLDNRRKNIRVVTIAENQQNRKKGRGFIQSIASSAGNIFYRGVVNQNKVRYHTSFVRNRDRALADLEQLKIGAGVQSG